MSKPSYIEFAELEKIIEEMPATWCLIILKKVIQSCVKNNLFITDGEPINLGRVSNLQYAVGIWEKEAKK